VAIQDSAAGPRPAGGTATRGYAGSVVANQTVDARAGLAFDGSKEFVEAPIQPARLTTDFTLKLGSPADDRGQRSEASLEGSAART